MRLFSFSIVALLVYAVSAGSLDLSVAHLQLGKYLAKLATLAVAAVLQYNLNRLISFRKSAPIKSEWLQPTKF